MVQPFWASWPEQVLRSTAGLPLPGTRVGKAPPGGGAGRPGAVHTWGLQRMGIGDIALWASPGDMSPRRDVA